MWVSLSQPGHKLPTLQMAERACCEISSPSYSHAKTHQEQNCCFQLFYKKSVFARERWNIGVFFFPFLLKLTDGGDILIPLPLSVLLRFLRDSLILCPSYGPEYHPILWTQQEHYHIPLWSSNPHGRSLSDRGHGTNKRTTVIKPAFSYQCLY